MGRLRDDIERICGHGLDARTLRLRVMARLGQDVAHDAYCFGTIDPWTLLITDDVSEGIPPGNGGLAAHNEYLVPDVDKFADLARTGRTVGILSRSAGGDPSRSARFRTVLPVIGARHELRAVFTTDGECWGALTMFRQAGRGDFTPREAALVRALSQPVAAALRRACVDAAQAVPPGPAGPAGPGILVLDGEGRTLIANETARYWLDELGAQALHEVSAAARAGRGEEAYLRVRSRTGRWLSLWGSPLDGDPRDGAPAGGTSVVIQPTPTSGITEMLALGYGLTAREREILQHVISGRSSTGIASELTMSPYTVQDHLKSVFGKFGVRSRGQLVARALDIAPVDVSPTES
ncbi:helix-turn-helix transcriptional regulator [Streptomyces fuscichromogenes]|uniref:Helix-turn-helix transcriptional regulator n=1 Tax=Streptomyces fuscichromogenes TaxID=1324013 RepID=A0A917XAC4_9ACTN|nr:helix-turn-helix transcriptional regulator [Streptomyces fuscichromogenes]GGN00493.1 helix-turn-helix transcriptional regulator [Streptomyces fuscichromogenes]